MDDIAYWLALQRTPGIGTITMIKLLEQFDSPRHIFETNLAELTNSKLLRKNSVLYLKSPDWKTIEKDLAWAEQANNHIITIQNPAYPSLLKEIADPPALLFVTGDPALLQQNQLAIVGSRNPSRNGNETAAAFAGELSQQGLIITSGLALGIDGASHAGALATNNPTIAVIGTGLDKVYPARHHQLAVKISETGALVSEFSLGTPPIAVNFPKRNRIISGLSIGTLVVEAALKSGSLITAHMAIEQNREVFAIPGSINNPLSKGCHKLIREGAKLVETTHDILEELAPLCELNEGIAPLCELNIARVDQSKTDNDEPDPHNTEHHDKFLHNIGFDPISIDNLVLRSGLSIDTITSLLLVLELQGKITSSNGFYYRLKT